MTTTFDFVSPLTAPAGYPTIDASGTLVAFSTTDPVSAQTQVFLKNETTGTLSIVSTSAVGTSANAYSSYPTIAGNGGSVAFTSKASNLVPGVPADTFEVYSKTLAGGGLVLVSQTAAGVAANHSSDPPEVSADGVLVGFSSAATNLDPHAGNGNKQAYVKNLATGALTLASQSASGVVSNDGSSLYFASISATGNVVAFVSAATNLGSLSGKIQVYVKNLATGALTIASESAIGTPGNADSNEASLSADGTLVAFQSSATNLVTGVTSGTAEIYLKNLVTNTVTLVSDTPAGVIANGDALGVEISADGQYVAFVSSATNLVAGVGAASEQVYVKNLKTGALALLSRDAGGNAGNGFSSLSVGFGEPVFSADDTRIVFQTTATNLGAPANSSVVLRATTTVPSLTLSPVAGDDFVNAAEASGTVVVGGSSDEPGQPVTVALDGVGIGTATVGANGAWSVSIPSPGALAQGAHTITATVQGDSYLSTDAAESFTLDTFAPAVAIATPGAFTNQPGQVITGTGEAGTVVTLTDNGVVTAQAGVAADGTWSAASNLGADGLHDIVALDTDAAGNVGTSNPIAFALDATPPVLGFDPTPTFSSPTTVTLTGTLFDASGVTGAEMFEGGTDLGPATLNGDGTFTFTTDFAPGFHNGLAARVTDGFGNVSLVPTDFDVTAGIKHQLYTASLDNYAPDGTFLGQTEFTKPGGTYLRYAYTAFPDGHEEYDYESGSFFKGKAYSAYQDIFTATGDIGTESFDNRNGTHDTTLYANGQTAAAEGRDSFTAAGKKETFVFDPGFGQDMVAGFHAAGATHDTLSLSSAIFSSVAQVLALTHDGVNGAVISAGQGDKITIEGVTKAELQANKKDFVLHA